MGLGIAVIVVPPPLPPLPCRVVVDVLVRHLDVQRLLGPLAEVGQTEGDPGCGRRRRDFGDPRGVHRVRAVGLGAGAVMRLRDGPDLPRADDPVEGARRDVVPALVVAVGAPAGAAGVAGSFDRGEVGADVNPLAGREVEGEAAGVDGDAVGAVVPHGLHQIRRHCLGPLGDGLIALLLPVGAVEDPALFESQCDAGGGVGEREGLAPHPRREHGHDPRIELCLRLRVEREHHPAGDLAEAVVSGRSAPMVADLAKRGHGLGGVGAPEHEAPDGLLALVAEGTDGLERVPGERLAPRREDVGDHLDHPALRHLHLAERHRLGPGVPPLPELHRSPPFFFANAGAGVST